MRKSALPLPDYHSAGAAGMDLLADIDATITLESLDRCAVPTGIAVEIPSGFEGQVRPRSGRALREGLTLLNTPGYNRLRLSRRNPGDRGKPRPRPGCD